MHPYSAVAVSPYVIYRTPFSRMTLHEIAAIPESASSDIEMCVVSPITIGTRVC